MTDPSTNAPESAASAIDKASAAQRAAASAEASVWVSASAGAGKTKVLTDRVLNLLLAGAAPSKLLCLTFTKAAAAEMSNRLSKRLSSWTVEDEAKLRSELEDLLGRYAGQRDIVKARRLFAEVLDAPGGMRIQTIHSFCQSVLKRFPLEAGVSPQFDVLEDRTAAEMLRAALEHVLIGAKTEPEGKAAAALAHVSAEVSEQELEALLADLSTERSRLTSLIGEIGGLDALRPAIGEKLGIAPDANEADLLAAACAEQAFDGDGLRQATEQLLGGKSTDQKRGEKLAEWLADPAARVALFDRYVSAFFTGKGEPPKSLATKEVVERMPDVITILEAEQARLAEIIATRKSIRIAASTTALLRLAGEMLAAYETSKSHRALLDYDDLVLRTRDLLRLPGIAPWVLYKLDGGIDHILIDEAQDTNPEQWDVIGALSEEFFSGEGRRDESGPGEVPEPTIFAVGDVKQSIYSFQRADPSGFGRMRELFSTRAVEAGRVWRHVDLDISFRSTNAVLKAVDAVFARPEARDGVAEAGADGEIRDIAHQASRAGQGGRVELWPSLKPTDDGTADIWELPLVARSSQNPRSDMARGVADQIADWIRGGEILPSQNRSVRPGDIMVLVRQRGGFVEELSRALKGLDIPVAGIDRMVLSDQLAVMDLTALGNFLVLPEDDLNLAAVLKGPLIRFSEDDLFELAWDRKEKHLWRELRRRAGENDTFSDADEKLSAWLAEADRSPPFEFFSRLLAQGGRRDLVARLGIESLDPLDEFLDQALNFEASRTPSLQGFLSWLAAADFTVKRDLEGGDADQVRIMTVHGSKGLQAPIVILPDTTSKPRHAPRLHWVGGDRSVPGQREEMVLWSPRQDADDPVTKAARAKSKQEQEQEYRRLLYVAMTRAEDRLYVCGWEGARRAAEGSWHELVSRGLVPVAETFAAEPDSAEQGLVLDEPQTADPEKPKGHAAVSSAEVPLPGWATRPAGDEPWPERPLAPSRQDDAPSVRSPFDDDAGVERFKRGNLIHRLLQTLPELPRDERLAAARRFLARPVNKLSPENVDHYANETIAVLDHPGFAHVFAPGSKAEAPIVGQVGEGEQAQVISGQIDRLLVEAGRVTVVDFKTNRPPPKTADATPEVYLKQMAAYRDLLREIYPDRAVECALLWTDGPNLMPISDDLLNPFSRSNSA